MISKKAVMGLIMVLAAIVTVGCGSNDPDLSGSLTNFEIHFLQNGRPIEDDRVILDRESPETLLIRIVNSDDPVAAVVSVIVSNDVQSLLTLEDGIIVRNNSSRVIPTGTTILKWWLLAKQSPLEKISFRLDGRGGPINCKLTVIVR